MLVVGLLLFLWNEWYILDVSLSFSLLLLLLLLSQSLTSAPPNRSASVLLSLMTDVTPLVHRPVMFAVVVVVVVSKLIIVLLICQVCMCVWSRAGQSNKRRREVAQLVAYCILLLCLSVQSKFGRESVQKMKRPKCNQCTINHTSSSRTTTTSALLPTRNNNNITQTDRRRQTKTDATRQFDRIWIWSSIDQDNDDDDNRRETNCCLRLCKRRKSSSSSSQTKQVN